MPARRIIPIGKKFGRLTILKEVKPPEHVKQQNERHVRCRCQCGNIVKAARIKNVLNGQTKSCGCHKSEASSRRATGNQYNLKHGWSQHPLYRTHRGMLNRCLDPESRDFAWWGGRGIRVCRAWLDRDAFIAWALVNGWEPGLTIERVDNDGHYTPRNCKFVTQAVQNRNRRNNRHYEFRGRWLTIHEIARVVGMYPQTLWVRLEKGYTLDEATQLHNFKTGRRLFCA